MLDRAPVTHICASRNSSASSGYSPLSLEVQAEALITLNKQGIFLRMSWKDVLIESDASTRTEKPKMDKWCHKLDEHGATVSRWLEMANSGEIISAVHIMVSGS